MLVVVTGGARSGKSAVAQDLAVQLDAAGVPVTVAVFGRPDDAEMAERIARHREDRPAGFRTVEVADPRAWSAQAVHGGLLVDCMGTLLGRIMTLDHAGRTGEAPGFSTDEEVAEEHARAVEYALSVVAQDLIGRTDPTIVVTNEVGDGVVPAFASGRLFRDVLGRVNRLLVDHADAAYLCVAGRLIGLDTLPTRARWPQD